MGEGFYDSFDGIDGSESPSKRARTASPCDHGTLPLSPALRVTFAIVLPAGEADARNRDGG